MRECRIHIDKGAITNRKAVALAFKDLKDGPYLVTIKSVRRRSLPQNDYYWACVVPMVKQGLKNAGYDEVETDEDTHEVLKHLFLKKEVFNKNTGEVITEIAGSTTKLQTYEFNEYLEKIWRWAAQYLDMKIPSPNGQIPIDHLTK